MLKLNLIPPHILERKRVKRLLILCLIALAILAAALLGWFWVLKGRLARLEQDHGALESRASGVKNIVSQKESVQQETAPLETKLTFMRDLETFNAQWADLIEQINEYIPRTVQVTALQLTPGAVQLQGMTYNSTENLLLIDRNFRRCPVLNPATVVYQPSVGPGGAQAADQLTQFSLSAALAEPLVIPSLGGAAPAQGGFGAGEFGAGGSSIPGGAMPGMSGGLMPGPGMSGGLMPGPGSSAGMPPASGGGAGVSADDDR